MINMPNSTKEQYKAFEREISVYGNLYLAKKRLTKNLFNPYSTRYDTNTTSSVDSTETITASYSSSIGTTNAYLTYVITLKENTDYTFKCKYTRSNTSINAQLVIRTGLYSGDYIASTTINDATGTKTLHFNSGSYTTLYVWFYLKNAISIQAIDTTFKFSEIMLNEGTEALDFEYYSKYAYDYTLFALTEENQAKILSFNINEKCDVYYTSLPYNTMSLEVDNEKGYFTDYDPDSIVNKLNGDCYVEVFMKINDDDYYKIMKMNFDGISYSDYEKAKLTFKSSIARLKNLILKDNRNEDFSVSVWTRARLSSWLNINYNITYAYSNSINVLNSLITKSNSVENIILGAGTYNGTLDTAVLTLNDTNDYISAKTWSSTSSDSIIKDYQLEKPIVKRENSYNGVDYTLLSNRSYESSNETYNLVINGTLNSTRETLVIRDDEYRLSTMTSDNISVSGDITVEVSTYSSNFNIVMLKLSGAIGQEYTITINKENVAKRINYSLTKSTVGIVSDTSKTLTIEESSPLYINYYNLILNDKKIKSNIEVKIIGLPYLELGDTVEIETDNANVLTTISEIDMDFDGGLTMTIKGYELGWDALFPSDTLYPSDDLYPNTPI